MFRGETGHCLKELKNELVQSYHGYPPPLVVHLAQQLFSVHTNEETGPSDFSMTSGNDLYLNF